MSATYKDSQTNGGNVKFEMNLHHIYPKPSEKELADARPCRLFLVFTFVLFLLGFLAASVVLIIISDKCNNREKNVIPKPSRMQYQVYIKKFKDSDGDGVGDLVGLKDKLAYIKSLGANSILLNDAISTMDFKLDSEIGSDDDFKELIKYAKGMGLDVFLQMKPFVTSKNGDWFKNMSNTDWFIWCKKNEINNWVTVNGTSAWHVSRMVPNLAYYSYFGGDLPTLNLRNKAVAEAVKGKIKMWLGRGAKGLVLTDVSRLTVDEKFQANVGDKVYDKDLSSSHGVLSTLYETVRNADAKLWVIPGTSVELTTNYLGTRRKPESDFVLSDHLAKSITVDVNELNNSISNLLASTSSTDKIGWLVDGPVYQRIASRLSEKQAELISLFLLTFPNEVLHYYGDEKMLQNDRSGKSTSIMVFNNNLNRGFSSNSYMNLPAGRKVKISGGFVELAKLRSIKGIFTGTLKVVYADHGSVVLVYLQNSAIFVNFDGKGGVVSNLDKYFKKGKIVFSMNTYDVDQLVDFKNVTISPYDLFVVKTSDN